MFGLNRNIPEENGFTFCKNSFTFSYGRYILAENNFICWLHRNIVLGNRNMSEPENFNNLKRSPAEREITDLCYK